MAQRKSICLTASWRLAPDTLRNGEELGFWKVDHDDRSWLETTVPSCFEADCPNLAYYEGVCWYRHSFRVPDTWIGQRIAVQFGAVSYRARVWLNGELLGENHDGCLPFEFDIQPGLFADDQNVIAVEVDNTHHEGDVPGMHVGWHRFGGILREVNLYTTAHCYVKQAHVTAVPSESSGDMQFRVKICNTGLKDAVLSLSVAVHDAEDIVCTTKFSEPNAISAGISETVELASSLSPIQPWSPKSPTLYRAVIRLMADGQDVDEIEITFGFRHIGATRDGLLLNGKPIFLIGFNRHEDSPRTGMAADHELARQDLVEMKDAGANFVRLCHYPHHPKTLDMCDELGLLVFAEVPVYFWLDMNEGRRTNAARVRSAARQLERMVMRDFNHPSIIFWSVSNETLENEAEVQLSNEALIRGVRALDPTRLCVHVSSRWTSEPHFQEDAVICVNSYPSMALANNTAISTADLSEVTQTWKTNLAKLRERYPDKPILITEFGYASFAGTNGHAYGEDVHARVLKAEYAAFSEPYICGATIWCWADHPWPKGSSVNFMGGFHVSPFGVVTRDRQKLKAYWAACELFAAAASRQGNDVGINRIEPT